MPNTPPIPPRKPMPPPVPGKAGAKPPLPPAAALMRPVAGASQIPLTVAGLASSFRLDYLRDLITYQAKERGCAGVYSRPARIDGVAGGLIIHNGSRELLVFGDIHANLARLDLILKTIAPLLRSGKTDIVFLGDILHREATDLAEMGSSFKTLQAVIMLKRLFPERVHLLSGNHDNACSNEAMFDLIRNYSDVDHTGWPQYLGTLASQGKLQQKDIDFRMAVMKKKVFQALEFARFLYNHFRRPGRPNQEIWNDIYLFQRFFDTSPAAMIVEDRSKRQALFLAHSFAVADRDQLRDIHLPQRSDLFLKLLTNKPSDGQISEADVQTALRELQLPPDAIIITGHERPRTGFGYRAFSAVRYFVLHSNAPGFGYCKISGCVPTTIPFTADVLANEQASAVA